MDNLSKENNIGQKSFRASLWKRKLSSRYLLAFLLGLLGVGLTKTAFLEKSLDWTTLSLAMGSVMVSFLLFSPWKRVNSLVGGILLVAAGAWIFFSNDGFFITILWGIVFVLAGIVSGLKFFGLTPGYILHKLKKTTVGQWIGHVMGGINQILLNLAWLVGISIKALLRVASWILLVGSGIWLVVALGPLWIIAMLLFVILMLLLNNR